MGKNTEILLIILLVGVISLTSYFWMFGISFEGEEDDYYVPVIKGDNISTYKNSCNKLNLSQVSKDPYALIGKKVKLTGQILKKEEFMDFGKTRTHFVLKVPELSPDPYILFDYSDVVEFEQGDMITVYGEYGYPAKDETFPEIADKFLPLIKAGYIEKS